MKLLIGGVLMLALASLTSARVSVYQDNLSLWADARIHAPMKPRPALNFAAAMIAIGELDSANAVLGEAAHVALTRDRWERDHAEDIVTADRAVILLRQGNQQSAATVLAHADANPNHVLQSAVCQTFELCRQLHPPRPRP